LEIETRDSERGTTNKLTNFQQGKEKEKGKQLLFQIMNGSSNKTRALAPLSMVCVFLNVDHRDGWYGDLRRRRVVVVCSFVYM
jgi:hypothetical protein